MVFGVYLDLVPRYEARTESVLYPHQTITTLHLNAFRGEPASSGFDWHFTPNHNSSENFSTFTGSYLHVMLLTLHTGHG
jgi:hypothetical protein